MNQQIHWMKFGVEAIRRLIMEEKKRGAVILLASHNQEDIRILADCIYRIDRKIVCSEVREHEKRIFNRNCNISPSLPHAPLGMVKRQTYTDIMREKTIWINSKLRKFQESLAVEVCEDMKKICQNFQSY